VGFGSWVSGRAELCATSKYLVLIHRTTVHVDMIGDAHSWGPFADIACIICTDASGSRMNATKSGLSENAVRLSCWFCKVNSL
jgi:hypothetical protein